MRALVLAVLVSMSSMVYAQHDISTDLLGFAISKYGIGYDYSFNQTNSVGVYINYASENSFGEKSNQYGDISFSEFNVIPEYKYFLSPNKGTDIVYAGLYGKYRSSNSEGNKYEGVDPDNSAEMVSGKTDVSTTGLALGFLFGYKWVTTKALFFEISGGVGKFIVSDTKFSDSVVEDLNEEEFDEGDYVPYLGNDVNLDLRFNFKIGLRFQSQASN